MQPFQSYARSKLNRLYPGKETTVLMRILLKRFTSLNTAQIYCDKDTKIPGSAARLLREAVDRLAKGEPIQYIVGETEFFGLRLHVQKGVLIPRPETEELVDRILRLEKNTDGPLRILDIGTGSGCIAIALAKNLPKAQITAWDVSPEALDVARKNALDNRVNIQFECRDILAPALPISNKEQWNIVVSNPPYVRQQEKLEMEKRVLDYEPHLALFVSNEDPLRFYRAICHHAPQLLTAGGRLYVELNSRLGTETHLLIKQCAFENVELIQDLTGRDRFIRAQRRITPS